MHDQAFTKITLVPIFDITNSKSKAKPGTVKEICIGNTSSFVPSDLFAYDIPVTIYYHDKKEIQSPFSAKSIPGLCCDEVCSQLYSLGFSNIELVASKNFWANWIYPNGSVQSISINGNCSFKKNTTYKFDSQIIIEYHKK